jgi:DNA-binding transcriptional regulator YiaG
MRIMSGDEIKRRREALGMSQSELAGWAGVHVRTVSKWERGVHKPTPMLAVAFDLWERHPETFDPHAFGRRQPPAGGREDGQS